MLVWAIRNGGFDASTWYWGALVLLATFTAVFVGVFRGHLSLSRASAIAVGLFAAYVAWSYLSMTWAQYPGIALDGSNRALLYLLIFTLLTALPWTRRRRLARCCCSPSASGSSAWCSWCGWPSATNVTALFFGGRLVAPTGYINSTAALFTMDALVCSCWPRGGPAGPAARAAAGLRRRRASARHARPEPRMAVHAAPHRAGGDRARPRTASASRGRRDPGAGALIPVRRLLHIYQNGPTTP